MKLTSLRKAVQAIGNLLQASSSLRHNAHGRYRLGWQNEGCVTTCMLFFSSHFCSNSDPSCVGMTIQGLLIQTVIPTQEGSDSAINQWTGNCHTF